MLLLVFYVYVNCLVSLCVSVSLHVLFILVFGLLVSLEMSLGHACYLEADT